jgi:hypothetical protein
MPPPVLAGIFAAYWNRVPSKRKRVATVGLAGPEVAARRECFAAGALTCNQQQQHTWQQQRKGVSRDYCAGMPTGNLLMALPAPLP